MIKGPFMKAFNTKLITSFFLFLLFSCSTPKNNAELILEAKSYIQNGDNASAAIVLKNVIKNDDSLGEARYLLGHLYAKENKFLDAQKEIEKAIMSGYKEPFVFIELAKSQIATNQFDNVLSTLEEQKFISNDEKIQANFLMAQAFLRLDKIELAKKQIALANKVDNKSLYTLLGESLIAAYENNYEKALSLLTIILNKNNAMQDALLLKGSILSNQGHYLESAQTYLIYTKINPHNSGIKSLIAHNLIRGGEYKDAQKIVDELLNDGVDNPTVNVLAAQLSYLNKHYQKSKEFADKTLQITNNGLAKMISGLSSFYLKEYEQSYTKLTSIASNLPSDHQVHKVLAILQLKLGYTEELSKTINKLDNLNASDAELFANIGIGLAKKRKTKEASEMFSRAVNLAPLDAKIKAKQGIYKNFIDDDSATDDLKQALKLDPNLQEANIALAMSYLKQGKINNATKIAEAWLKNNPKNISALILNGNIALKKDKTDLASSYFKQAVALDETNTTSLFNLAVVLSDNKKFEESSQLLEQLINNNSEFPLAYRLLITNSINLHEEEKLEQTLKLLTTNKPNSIWPRIILARRYISKNQNDKAIELLRELNEFNRLPPAYFLALSNAYIKTNKNDVIDSLFEQWQTAQPQEIKAYTMYIDLLDRRQEYKRALTTIEKALKQPLFKNNFQLLSLEAYYLLANIQPEIANQKITLLAKQNPAHPFILRLEGQLALAKNNYDDAINYLLKSIKLKNNAFTGLYLATAYTKNNQEDKAITFLENSLKKYPDNKLYKNVLTELYINSSPQNAIKQYQEMISLNKNDYVALNNLAWVLYNDKQYQKAEKYALKAIKVQPKNPQILDTLGLIQIKLNNITGAIKSLEQANSILSRDKAIALHLVEAYKLNNNVDKAELLKAKFENAK